MQLSIHQLPDQLWDIAIIGAGPAGTTAATLLAKHGFSVLLLERHHIPRDKVCGDVLLPDAIAMLDKLGLLDQVRQAGHTLNSMRIYSPGRYSFDIDAEYLTLPRRQLDTLLARHAHQSGATICHATVTFVTQESDHAAVHTDTGQVIRAKLCLIATGSQVDTAHKLGLVADPHPDALAMRCYLESESTLPYGILSYDKELRPGYAWIFPLGNGRYNVGCGMLLHGQPDAGRKLRTMFDRFCADFPPMQQFLANGKLISHLTGAGIRTSFGPSDLISRDRICAIGETIGTTFPFTGEGIGTAMRSAQIAADHAAKILRGESPTFEPAVISMHNSFDELFSGYRKTEKWLKYGWVNDLIARRVEKSKFLKQACRGIILGTANPNEVYSLKGILKALLK